MQSSTRGTNGNVHPSAFAGRELNPDGGPLTTLSSEEPTITGTKRTKRKNKHKAASASGDAPSSKKRSEQQSHEVTPEKLAFLAREIHACHVSIGLLSHSAKEKIAETMTEVIRCGKMLLECKTHVKHGEWLKWLNDNCKMGVGTAQAYMRVSKGLLSNNQHADYLEGPKSIREAIALLSNAKHVSTPTDEKDGSPTEHEQSADRRISLLAKKLMAALRLLPPGEERRGVKALTEILKWVGSTRNNPD